VDITKERNAITIRFKTPKNWFLLLIGPIWLTGWTIGGIAAIRALINGTHDWFFYVFWLAGWIVGEVWVSFLVLWTAFGKEVVSIRNGTFEHAWHIFGFGRRRYFRLNKMSRLRAAGPFPALNSFKSSFKGGMPDGSVAVRVRPGKTYRLGTYLNKDQARNLVAELKPYFDTQKLNSTNLEKPADA
jgi:hypothetical protein